MKSAIRRTKLISIRLSPDECHEFQKTCDTKGFRSISDLARTAMHKLVAAENHADPLTYEVQDLRNQVQLISLELERITEAIDARNSLLAQPGPHRSL
jgi:Arc/MetJ-type ribon-helix-helix transcriptional regulator